jgi:CubicO group peptidase (beta-lactamase class C family)
LCARRIRDGTDVGATLAVDHLGEVSSMRLLPSMLAVAALVGCGGSTEAGSQFVRYHEPSQGWTAMVPAGWKSVVTGPQFVRGDPLRDPTRLLLRTYRSTMPAAALRRLAAGEGLSATVQRAEHVSEQLRWVRYQGLAAGRPKLAVALAVAKDDADSHVAALVAYPAELAGLVQSALLPALDSFEPGLPDPRRSVLAGRPPDPSYWPTSGWRTASPGSQAMDGKRLDAMLTEIRAAKLPIDSITVIRHGYAVLDASFGRFASGTLGEPFASGRLHELQSATKSVTSMLLGIALREHAATGITVKTPLLRLAAAVHYVPQHADARKQVMTLEDMLTMQSGLAWKESGYAYEPGSGNDVMAMLARTDWSQYVIDREMATQPGTTFVYNSGTSHLVSAAISVLTRRPAEALAAKSLFAPLGVRDYKWLGSPEGVSSGAFGLQLQPRDLAKLAFLYLHHGRWDGRQIVPAAWVEQSATDHVTDPTTEYGYLWWLDRADGYAYMAGLYGQVAAVVPGKDLVAVITAHIPADVDSSSVTRWLLENYVLPAAR